MVLKVTKIQLYATGTEKYFSRVLTSFTLVQKISAETSENKKNWQNLLRLIVRIT